MAVQARSEATAKPLILGGNPRFRDDATIARISARSTTLAKGTILVISAAGAIGPADYSTTLTGTLYGVLLEDIPAAAIAAADVANKPVLRGHCAVDEDLLVFEGLSPRVITELHRVALAKDLCITLRGSVTTTRSENV